MRHRCIFRLTNYRNIEQFCLDGSVFAKNWLPTQPCYRTSYVDIVNRRGTEAFGTPCGNVVNDFVPFYFSPITAMAFTIQRGNVRLIAPNGQDMGAALIDEIVFLVSNTSHFSAMSDQIWFTDVACNSAARPPTYENDFARLDDHIDWSLFDERPITGSIPAIGYPGVCKYFKDFDEPERYRNRKAQRMAEFLVRNSLPLGLVDCIVCKNDEVARLVRQMLQNGNRQIPVHVEPGCYF